MSKLRNDRLLRALGRKPVDCTPVWIMRQAGRYLPEYRETRKQAGDFLTLCKTPELACEVTLQPLRRFDLDAAIVFSDILTIPDAMGLGLSVNEGEGPRFERVIDSKNAIDALRVPEEDDLGYVFDAVRTIHHELDGSVPLIGFAGSPWTLATYMVEGQSTRDFARIKGLMYEQPQALHALLDVLAESVSGYLAAQVKAGADVLMIFDTWGGVLPHTEYREFSLSAMRRIVEALKSDEMTRHIPVILFTKGGGQWLKEMAESGCDALGCDWTTSLAVARNTVGEQVHFKATWTPLCSMRVQMSLSVLSNQCWVILVWGVVMCLTSVTALRQVSIPTTSG